MITCQTFSPKVTLAIYPEKTTIGTSGILTEHMLDHQPCTMTIDLDLPKPKLMKIRKRDTDAIPNSQEELPGSEYKHLR